MLAVSAFISDIMAQQKIIQTAGRDALGDFAPEFAHLNILFVRYGVVTISFHFETVAL